MGDDALTTPEKDGEGQVIEPQTKDGDDDLSEEQKVEQPAEVEIVREGEEGSQPRNRTTGFQRRVNKLNAKVTAAVDNEAATAQALVAKQNELDVTKIALAQSREQNAVSALPDPNTFDDGVSDPQYAKAVQEHTQSIVRSEIAKQTANAPAPATAPSTVNPELVRKQNAHYEEAGKLAVKDYEDVEDKAIEILGQGTVNHIIASSDKSPMILYYLGKNPRRAEELAALVQTDGTRAAIEIGRLEVELKPKPLATTQSTPDPDTEIPGGSPTAGKANKFQKQLDKAREKAGETRDLSDVLSIRKAAKEAGVTVE